MLLDTEQNIFFSNVSAALVHAALEKCARQEGLMLYELLNATKGSRRRELHDDITCSVVRFI
jgi:hypothetical protein